MELILINRDNMDIEIISDTLDRLAYSSQVPDTLSHYLLTDTENIYAPGDYGTMLFQHLATADHTIWISSYFISRKAVFKSVSALPFLELHFTFKNSMRYQIEGIGTFEMGASRFNLTYLPFIESHT